MSEIDVFFRAFHEYKKNILKEKSINRLCEFIANSQNDEDNLETERTYCTIEEDWIKIIEEGMIYVEKAIREERQFIRKEGEVVPIEKLRHVSTDTVTHLARHSELITREPKEDETLTPEKLFMVENLSDSTVYENRFIYMLLCYTRDFISMRLDKIIELGRTFKMKGKVVKYVKMGAKKISYVSEMSFEDKKDGLSENYCELNSLIERIEEMQLLTVSLLGTPLMREVSKTPMIKPPITQTNVLRMNNNFKRAFEMYCKLSEYNKDGYIINKVKSTMRPFSDELIKEQVQLIALQQFLYYKHGNKLSAKLWEEFLLEEERIKEREKKALKEEAERLKKQIQQTGKGYEEYIKVIEKRMAEYDLLVNDLNVAKTKINNLSEKVDDTQKLLDNEKQKTLNLSSDLQKKEAEFSEFIIKKESEIKEINVKHEEEKTNIISEYDLKLCELEKTKSEEYQQLKENSAQQIDKLTNDLCESEKQAILVKAQLHGIRNQHGLVTSEEDFTSKERFNELEKEYEALKDLLDKQWHLTKKKIRKDILGKK